jgi:hypothetical protein|tara:strand:+ start:64 stop:285 length:222 start_codon:yes stop_codon:yes gene_type:complete
MKAILEFDLPEDTEQYNVATKAMDWALLVWDFNEQLIKWEKYEEHTDEEIDLMTTMRQFIANRMTAEGLSYPE